MNTNKATHMHRNKGFSLIELMVAIAVLGVLMSIAIPGYREHLRRGAVEEALAELSRGRVAVEQFFLDNRTYTGCPNPASTTRFALTCTAGNGVPSTTYVLRATGSGNVNGFVYTINEQGVRTTSSSWGNSNSCWVIKKGGSCGG